MKLIPLAALTLWSTAAAAQQVSVVIDPDAADAAGVDASSVESDLRSAMGDKLHLDGQDVYLEKMAQAAISSTKGMGVDYATNPQRFVFGGSAGSAANGTGFTLSRDPAEGLPEGGFAFQAMVMGGLNLGIASGDKSFLRRVVVYVNGMASSNSKEPFSADLYNYGAHLQLKLIRPPSLGVVEWGGLDLSSGYEASSYSLTLGKDLPISADPVTWDATGTYTISSSATSVPVELSTNMRITVVSLYVGGAMDFNLTGEATSEVELSGPLRATANGQTADLGAATISAGTTGLATEQVVRFFGGVQANVLMVKVYAHANIGMDDSYGGHVGLRVSM